MKNLMLAAIAAVALFMGANALVEAANTSPVNETCTYVEIFEASDELTFGAAVPCAGCEAGCAGCGRVSIENATAGAAVPCAGCEAGCAGCGKVSVENATAGAAVPCAGCEAGCAGCGKASLAGAEAGSIAVMKRASAGQLVRADIKACGGCGSCGPAKACGGCSGCAPAKACAGNCGNGCAGKACQNCDTCKTEAKTEATKGCCGNKAKTEEAVEK